MRKNIRLKEYDYTKKGMYFITLCAKNMNSIFGNLVDNKMILNDVGKTVEDIIRNFKNENYEIVHYQMMPNHIHYIIELKNDGGILLSKTVSFLKGKCTFELKNKELWQRGFYERVIRDEKEYNNIVKYINENPYREKYNW